MQFECIELVKRHDIEQLQNGLFGLKVARDIQMYTSIREAWPIDDGHSRQCNFRFRLHVAFDGQQRSQRLNSMEYSTCRITNDRYTMSCLNFYLVCLIAAAGFIFR